MSNLSAKTSLSLAKELGEVLLMQNKKVTSVESCTGGGIAYAITEIAGSSAWFEQSWVSYSNPAKMQLVGVSTSTLSEHGAVSSEVVLEMAQGALSRSGADISVAVSGIAGPGGGSVDKPVGLVWFAICDHSDCRTFSRCFSGDRTQVREQAIKLALQELISSLVTS